MTSYFNLLDEPWIPVRSLQTGQFEHLGLLAVFERSQSLGEIEDVSPLVMTSLYRLLLAVLYRALHGPTSTEQLKTWFDQGLPLDQVTAYLQQWRERFWLFDERYPFAQIAEFKDPEKRSWTVLAAEHNADNAKVLFDHTGIQTAGSIPAARAALWLLAAQTFSISAGKSKLAHTGTAPSAKAALVLPLGSNLQRTLLLALVPQNTELLRGDKPVWEREPETLDQLRKETERREYGLSDLYLWRSRTVRLERELDGSVVSVNFASGVNFPKEIAVDPMSAYKPRKEAQVQIGFDTDRGLWRDFDSLLPGTQGQQPPTVIKQAIELTRKRPDHFPRSVVVMGQAADKSGQAIIEAWRCERFVLPRALVGEVEVRVLIKELLRYAESAGNELEEACKVFARHTLSRGERKADEKKDVRPFIEQMGLSGQYWSLLEPVFHQVLLQYDTAADTEQLQLKWYQAVLQSIDQVWQRYRREAVSTTARSLRAWVRADERLGKARRQVKEDIAQLSAENKP